MDSLHQRYIFFDVVKALLMYFVIRGHLVAANIVSVALTLEPAWIGAMVVGASMPCFFAISGLFAYRNYESKNWSKITSHIIGLLWPVVSFGLMFGICLTFAGKGCQALWRTPYQLFQNLWFIRTLVFTNIISVLVFVSSNRKWVRLLLFFISYVVLVFLPRQTPCYYWAKDVMNMLPYFVFGLFYLKRCLDKDNFPFAMLAGVIFLGIAFSEGRVRDNGMGFYWVSHHWRDLLLTWHGILCFFGRTVMGIVGIISILWFFRWLLEKVSWLDNFAPFGQTTLGIYVMHQWILAHMGTRFQPPFPLEHGWKWLIAVIVFLVFHIIVITIKKQRIVSMLIFGNGFGCFIRQLYQCKIFCLKQ